MDHVKCRRQVKARVIFVCTLVLFRFSTHGYYLLFPLFLAFISRTLVPFPYSFSRSFLIYSILKMHPITLTRHYTIFTAYHFIIPNPTFIPSPPYRRLLSFLEYTNLLIAAENRCSNSSSPGSASVNMPPVASSLNIFIDFDTLSN